MLNRIVRIVVIVIISQILVACAVSTPSENINSLKDSSWLLAQFPKQSILPDRPVTLNFENDMIYGTDGCNRYRAAYQAMYSKLSVNKNIASTQMACPQPVMLQSTAFINALSQTSNYQRQGKTLILSDANGKTLAVFTEQSQELGGTSWLVSGYNNGKQAVVSVIIDSKLTAEFSSAGEVSGFAGCNNYTAKYKHSNKNVKIEQVSATRKYCDHPVGVMEQESRFLKALETVASYRQEGHKLEFRTAEGALAVSLSAIIPVGFDARD